VLLFIALECSSRGATTIDARIIKHRLWGTMIDIDGYNADGFDIEPVATLNGDTLQGYPTRGSPYIRYRDSVPWVQPGDECRLVLDYGYGVFESTEIMSAEFRITDPDTNLVLYRYDDLIINWDTPAGADWYELRVYIECYYYDSSGSQEHFGFALDSVLYENTCTISGNLIFPDYVNSVDTLLPHGGKVNVVAVSGPFVTHDYRDEFFDADTGWFNCFYHLDPVYLDIDIDDK
jgi:hypothetical protein